MIFRGTCFLVIFFLSHFLTFSFVSASPILFDVLSSLNAANGRISDNIPISFNFDNISPGNDNHPYSLKVQLKGAEFTLLKKRIVKRGENNFTWYGAVDEIPGSNVILTVINGYLRGRIDVANDSFVISMVNGGYVLTEVDQSKSISFGNDFIKANRFRAFSLPEVDAADNGSVIDVMVVYTQELLTKYGGSLPAMIQNYVDIANTAYTNSGISTQLNLVHYQLYDNSNRVTNLGVYAALTYLRADVSLAALRNTHAADVVSLLRVYGGNGTACGLGYLGSTDGSGQTSAFSVVEILPYSESNGGAYCDDVALAHEIGHNLGCEHDRANASGSGAYSYSYGYGVTGTFGTIMSYITPYIYYFSTPNKSYQGHVLGIAEGNSDSADNVSTINNMRSVIAAYKTSSGTTTTSGLSVPANFTASTSGSTVDVSWSASTGTSGYKLYYGTSSGSYLGSVDLGNVTSKSFSGVGTGTYYLVVTAYNSQGTESSHSSEVSVTVTSSTLSPPTSLTGTVSGSSVSLTWTAGNLASGYRLYYGVTSGTYVAYIDLGNVTAKTFSNIGAGTYFVTLKSYDASGNLSDSSTEVSLTFN